MTDEQGETAKTPWHLWVVGIASLLWNAMGCLSYTMTKLGRLESMDMPANQIEFYSNFPAWATAFWALGVWGCLLGSLFLLLRTKLSVWMFRISIIGLIGTTIFQWGIADMPVELKTAGHIAFAVVIWVITIALYLYAVRARNAGVLR